MEEKNNNLPPGFRFHPTDEELINYYLTSKVSDANGFTCKAIAVVDLNKSEPWDLPAKASMGDKVWYFFSLRDRKYPTGLRTNRATESGYWKTTGKDKHIFHGGALVGFKKTLVFYQGRAPRGLKSNWVMHEYRLHNTPHFAPSKEEWVVCRVLQKSTSTAKKPQEMTSSSQVSLDSPCDATSSMVNELANFTSLTNSSAGFMNNNIIPPTNHNINIGDHSDINTNMNLSRSWLSSSSAAEQVPSLVPWPASASRGLMLNPNLSVNSLLLKALQLKNINDPFVASSYMSQAAISNNLGGTHDHVSASHQPDQPFNLDSVW